MQTTLMTIFTRTPLHVGSGSSVGAIDLPVIRERHTQFPIIPGSAIKGVLADEFLTPDRKSLTAEGEIIFGYIDKNSEDEKTKLSAAGSVSFGEAKLVAFPLRSAKGSYALATCPLALSRLKRDANLTYDIPAIAKDGQCLAGSAVVLENKKVALEEYVFDNQGEFPQAWADYLCGLLADEVLKEAKTRLVLLSDGDFQYFAANACMVQHHNKIDDETGVVAKGALFCVETVPSETLFYAPLTIMKANSEVQMLLDKFKDETLLQFGGKSTTGLGFCTVKLNA